ncbi:D-alanyl-D-alanine carboxypeptidase/D-alanyl-D-alanine endopeptidase [Actibacterium ureilyticum]|uniref:D-alanyl-D-alanine carboxypeptidase/D-alanyl-D-alanine endopeptidase n=1 Tax=Actibacterium ureilyticum TaxID=1590614 RepID=UPI00159591D9|nr:D-alanyl-D-alanine carboxypeptidase/D-alanyl-D-alanine-endopeptidase [Actibacterium ureilyticum]
MTLSRRALLGGLAASAALPAWAEAPARSIRPTPRPGGLHKQAVPEIDTLLDQARLGGKTGFVVADARTGAVVESARPLMALPPASVTKSLTAIYALETLGPAYRFRTRLVTNGAVTNGRLDGDLILSGSGDPVLDTDMLGDLAAQLKIAGVREVTGRFLYDSGALPDKRAIDPEQPDHLGYNPAISGLNLNFNRVHFEWKRASEGFAITMEARARRFRPQVGVARMQIVDRNAPVYTYSTKGEVDNWTVARGALGKGGSRWLPVRRPELYAAEVFRTLARSHGIVLDRGAPGTTPADGTVMAEHASPPLQDILRDMLKYSTNLTAEVVGMTATKARLGRVDSLAQSARAMSDWSAQRLGTRHAALHDHSGLGDGSRISASDMVRILVAMGPDGGLRDLLKAVNLPKDMAVPGPVQPDIRAKTGTLNFVSALAGYIRTPDGQDLAFAIFSADEDRRAALSRAQRERPDGGRSWARRARHLQQQLLSRWSVLHGT